MIAEALRVLLFGMLGIFLVMAIIYGVIVALQSLSNKASRRDAAGGMPVAGEVIEVAEPVEVVEEVEEVYYYPEDYVAEEYASEDYGSGEYAVEGYSEGEYSEYVPETQFVVEEEYVVEPEVEVVER